MGQMRGTSTGTPQSWAEPPCPACRAREHRLPPDSPVYGSKFLICVSLLFFPKEKEKNHSPVSLLLLLLGRQSRETKAATSHPPVAESSRAPEKQFGTRLCNGLTELKLIHPTQLVLAAGISQTRTARVSAPGTSPNTLPAAGTRQAMDATSRLHMHFRTPDPTARSSLVLSKKKTEGRKETLVPRSHLENNHGTAC